MNKKISEKQIQKAILEWLAYRKILVWRNNTGMIIVGDKKKRAIRMGTKGVSDIIGCLPDGRILCIEVKSEKGKLSDAQKEFLDKINKMNGVAFVARSIEDCIKELKRSE